MITIKKINVKFEKSIFEDGEIIVNEGKVTTIMGESGVGKTTLLYMLGLISSEKNAEYYWDDKKVDLNNDIECSEIRKKKIGYVFQENNLNEKLTVKENIELSAKIAGLNLSEEEIKLLLNYVNLNCNINDYTGKLSGGERQRLAIACALSKKPELIIADEPTSALDSKNTKLIMDIFKKYAHEENKKIVIATHNQYVSDESDVQYHIENKKIVAENKSENKEHTNVNNEDEKKSSDSNKRNEKIGIRFLFDYAFNSERKELMKKTFIRLLLSFAIAFTILSFNFGEKYKTDLNDKINNIANDNILVINESAPLQENKNIDDYMSFEQDPLNKISHIQGVEKVYPLIEYRSFSTSDDIVSCSITKQDGSVYTFNQESGSELSQYTVLPYVDEEYMQKRSVKCVDIDEGVYISATLASKLDINNSDKEKLKVEICIPIDVVKGEISYNDVDYPADYDKVKKDTIEVNVKGILNDDFTNTYSIYGNDSIYMNYDEMKKILDEKMKKNQKEFKSSAAIVLIKDFSLLGDLKNKIANINPNYVCTSEFQDVESMKAAINSTKTAVMIFSIILFLVMFILMSVIYVQQTEKRKYEFAMLKANGLTKGEITRLVCVEALLDVIKIAIAAVIIMLAVVLVSYILLGLNMIIIEAKSIVLLLLISIVTIYIPTIITLKYINKYEPAKVMRG